MVPQSADITKPEAEDQLRKAVKSGAIGLGELKSHMEANGPELRRMYALAAELNVPILVHFQEVPNTQTEGVFSTRFKDFAFWANIGADYSKSGSWNRL